MKWSMIDDILNSVVKPCQICKGAGTVKDRLRSFLLCKKCEGYGTTTKVYYKELERALIEAYVDGKESVKFHHE